MSHIHIPDGVLPLWLIAAGWAISFLGVALSAYLLRNRSDRSVPLLGVMAAMMLVGMSTEIVPIAYHINLSVLAGIILGPAFAFPTALIVDLILALFGHGGITVVGLNTLVISSEMILGWLAYRALLSLFLRIARKSAPAFASGIAVGLSLFISTLLLIGIVWVANLNPAEARDTGSLNPSTLAFGNPFDSGLISNTIVSPEPRTEAGQAVEGAATQQAPDITVFARAVLLLGLIGWILEGVITGVIVGFIAQIRPDLVRLRPGSRRY